MSQGSFSPKIRFIGQKMWPITRAHTDRHTDRQTRKWIQRTPFQGFRNFSFNLSSRIGPIDKAVMMMMKIVNVILWLHITSQTNYIISYNCRCAGKSIKYNVKKVTDNFLLWSLTMPWICKSRKDKDKISWNINIWRFFFFYKIIIGLQMILGEIASQVIILDITERTKKYL